MEKRSVFVQEIYTECEINAPFFFLGKHRFEIIPLSEDTTKFINAEEFSGLAVPFARRKILQQNTRRFKENVNSALKKKIETPAS